MLRLPSFDDSRILSFPAVDDGERRFRRDKAVKEHVRASELDRLEGMLGVHVIDYRPDVAAHGIDILRNRFYTAARHQTVEHSVDLPGNARVLFFKDAGVDELARLRGPNDEGARRRHVQDRTLFVDADDAVGNEQTKRIHDVFGCGQASAHAASVDLSFVACLDIFARREFVGLLHDFGNEVSGFARIDERALASVPNGSCTVVGEPVEGLLRNDLAHEHQRALLVPVVSCRLPDEVVFADVVVVEPSGEAGGIGVPSFTVSRDDDVRHGLAYVMQKPGKPASEKPAF